MEKHKILPEVIDVLKNFAGINPNIVFKDNEVIKSINEARNVLASAEIHHPFPSDTGIYDLNEFLSALSMFKSPTLAFADDLTNVTISEGSRSIRYFFSSPEIMVKASDAYRDITFPDHFLSFSLSNDEIKDMKKAASTLGMTDLVVASDGEGGVSAFVTDTKNPTANSFSYSLTDFVIGDTLESFSFIFDIKNLKMAAGDYEVFITPKRISKFVNKTVPLQYMIGLDNTSEFTERSDA